MSDIFLTSDNHYHHKNILNLCRSTRLGDSVEEMNELMIDAHNSVVNPDDTVYFLGDFSFGTDDQTEVILDRLNGKKHIILGNHDKVIRESSVLQSKFESVQDYKQIKIEKKMVMLFHYPIRDWNMMYQKSYHLYGHCHGRLEASRNGRSMDVGIDARPCDMKPWSWEEIQVRLEKS